jgi:iron(II)-dependent oxidoreductase
LAAAWREFEANMALVPGGATWLAQMPTAYHDADTANTSIPMEVASYYLDRCAVTNAQYREFVVAGGYNNDELWLPEVLPHALDLVDQTGRPGPRYWSHGSPPKGKLNHPVVGVSWYEATAFAQWQCKRLPTPAEWQRAGCWSLASGSGVESKYPWGNTFDPSRANLWQNGAGDTVPVDSYLEGSTRNGVYQLVGNVWEWTTGHFDGAGNEGDSQFLFDQTMAEIRGGAFDTYFPTQASCRYRSGQPLLYRGANVGFRCCITAAELPRLPDPSELVEARI